MFRNKLAPFIFVTLIFTLMHIANPEFYTDYIKGFLGYLAISVLLGIVTVLDDGLEVACGIHAANNVFAAVVISTKDGSFITDSIFVSSVAELMKYSPYLDIGICLVAFLIFFHMFRWRFSTLLESTEPLLRPDDVNQRERRNSDAETVAAER